MRAGWLVAAVLASAVAGGAQSQFDVAMPRPSPFGDFLVGYDVAAADLDGDGDVDFMFATETGMRLFVREDAGFRDASSTLPFTNGNHGFVLPADTDGDGDLDVLLFAASGRAGMAASVLWRNDGALRFTQLPIGLPSAYAVAIADLDADGDPDLLLATVVGTAGVLTTIVNDGAGRFRSTAIPGLVLTGGAPRSLDVADFDADGDADVVIGSDSGLMWFDNQRGSFTSSRLDSDVFAAVAVADIDGDGIADLVAANTLGNRIVVHRGSVAGLLPATSWIAPQAPTTLLRLIDVDGDGRREVVIAGDGANTVARFWKNEGGFRFARMPSSPLPLFTPHVTELLEADVDGDGVDDIVQLAGLVRPASDVQVWLRSPSGFVDTRAARFPGAPPAQMGPALRGARNLATGDVDGDGHVDLVVDAGVFRNDGTGAFRLEANGFSGALQVALADLDRDGDLDRIAAGSSGIVVSVNDGSGRFGAEHWIATAPVSRLLVSDFDLDGNPDVLGISSASTHVHLRGTGSATAFIDVSVNFPRVAESTLCELLVDIDADGDLDVVLGNDSRLPWMPSCRVLRNDRGRFVDVSATALPTAWVPRAVTALTSADFDGDGNPDLLMTTTAESGFPSRIFRASSPGIFTHWRDVPALVMDSNGKCFAHDVDDDGWLDLIWLVGQSTLSVLRGLPGGEFVVDHERIAFDPRARLREANFAYEDVDGDGDRDLIGLFMVLGATGELQPILLRNHHRQLTAAEGPRRGAVWTQRVHAKPGYASAPHLAVPILGLAPASVALPPLGTLRVDLQSGVALPPFVVPASPGHADIGLAIPNDRSLLGVRVVTQALVVDLVTGAKFTNALVERVR
jgi:hypothetical protein